MVDYYETSPQGFLPLRARLPAASQPSRHRSRSLHGGAARAHGAAQVVAGHAARGFGEGEPPAAEQQTREPASRARACLLTIPPLRIVRCAGPPRAGGRRKTHCWPTCWPLAAGGVPLRVAAAALPGTATSQLVTPRSRAKAPVFISRLRVGSTVYTSRDRSTSLLFFFKRDRSTSRSGCGWLSEHVTPAVRLSCIHAL